MKKQSDFHKTVQNLMLLDPESLLLIDSGVKLLLARQNMGRKQERQQEREEFSAGPGQRRGRHTDRVIRVEIGEE